MLFRRDALPGLADGSTTVAFRRWTGPRVKAGGTLHTQVGMLAIDAVEVIDDDAISAADAIAAGFASPAEVLADLRAPEPGRALYRVAFHLQGDDPRAALRAAAELSAAELAELRRRLERFDRDAGEPWVQPVLGVIAAHPGEVSTALGERVGIERFELKRRIRKLKGLGLTESLQVGYRLSPRGEAVRQALWG